MQTAVGTRCNQVGALQNATTAVKDVRDRVLGLRQHTRAQVEPTIRQPAIDAARADHLDQELQRLRNGHTTARSADSLRLEDHNGKASPMQDRSGRHLSHGHTQVCSFRLPHRERYNPNRRRGISLVLGTVGAELVSVVVKCFSRAGYDSGLEQTCVGGFVSLSSALLLQQMGATWPLRLHRNGYLT